MEQVQKWHVEGDWFDVCSCDVPCPCTFAQAPTNNRCEGVLAYHIQQGSYGDTSLDGLNILAVSEFEGNIWGGETKAVMGIFLDERASDEQREALQAIWGGKAGGFPGEFAKLIGDLRGVETAPITFEVDEDLASWSAEIPGKVTASAEALTGPMTPEGKRVQTLNAPGSETGPGTVATWGRASADTVDAYGFKWEWAGQSSKHIPFDWSGPDEA